jgi:hypothetical protein
VISLLAIGALFTLSNSSKHPQPRKGPKTKVELLPDTDAYGRPIATPDPATPVPAKPSPATPTPAIPEPLATPTRIATPTPARLLPNIINP